MHAPTTLADRLRRQLVGYAIVEWERSSAKRNCLRLECANRSIAKSKPEPVRTRELGSGTEVVIKLTLSKSTWALPPVKTIERGPDGKTDPLWNEHVSSANVPAVMLGLELELRIKVVGEGVEPSTWQISLPGVFDVDET